MGMELKDFLEGIQTPVKKLTITQLRQREEFWRALWSWIPEDVKYFCLRVGQQVRIVKRDYKGSLGELGQVTFVPSLFELTVYEKFYNYNDGKYYYEDKVIKIPSQAVMWLEFVSESKLAEEVEQYSLDAIPETEEALNEP